MSHVAHELGLEGYLSTYGTEFVHPTELPDVAVVYTQNPNGWKNLVSKPYIRLPPSDLALLSEDPAKRQRWVALFTHTVMPSLRMLAEIIPNKARIAPPSHPVSSCYSRCACVQMHLPEFMGLGELNAKLPAVFPTGFDWNKVYNSPISMIFDLVIYARQCEAVLSQWVRSCVQCAIHIARHPSHHAFDHKVLR
jgi:hypothetical protein